MKRFPVFGWFCRLLVPAAVLASGRATIISIDLTQVGTESGANIAGDTWRWDSGSPALFDLEFSSGNGSHIDLDGGAQLGSEYYTGTEAATNHVYDIIRASLLGGDIWQIEAIRGATTYALGNVTEYSGSISHSSNYNFYASESHPIIGPADAGANAVTSDDFKAWFWIYRNTSDDTVSLNIVLGSGAAGYPGDGGTFRAEFTFGGTYSGTPSVLAANDGAGEISLSGSTFTGNWDWDVGGDDGGSIGGIQPVAIPEPGSAVAAGLVLCLFIFLRKRQG